MIPTATPPFGLGYKHTKDDLLEMEVMGRVIIVVIAVAVTMDMRMMTAAPIMRVIAAKIMIARTMAMIRVNPLVIEKIKM